MKEFIEVVSTLWCPVLEWILSLYAALTPYIKQLQGPQSAIASPLDCEVVLEEYKMASEWWVFLASSLLLRLISKPPTTVWVRRVKSETEVFTLILNLLSSPYNTLWLWKATHKANTCVKMYKELLLSFPYLRQRSLSQGQGLCVPKIFLGWAASKIFTSRGRIMHNQPAAARLHCGLLIQGATTETRIFMVKNPIDVSWVSRRRITPQNVKKIDYTEFF